MAVTTQNSTEYAATLATPLVKASARSNTGKLRTLAFSFNQDGVGDAGSIIVLGKLPAGRVKIIGGLSRFYCNIVASSATIDIGNQAYTDTDGNTVAEDVDSMVDGLDVDTAGYFTMEGNTAAQKLLGGNHKFNSKDGVVIQIKSIAALANDDDVDGVITYVLD
jgi:hypothetical protein|tara:strand:+ start:108 stop:599 length:492 start_codon:yes stop_codon:yes gene_type:complete